MPSDDILLDAEERMEKAVEYLRDELRGLRTGRATTGLVDSIRIEYYGSMTPLKQVANIAVPESNLIVVKPFDPSMCRDIEKAILDSELGITPNNDGKVIRLGVPPLSAERRKQLSARVRELAEEARVSLRNIRRDANKTADQEQKDKVLSEDERDDVKSEVQDLIKQYEAQVDERVKAKTTEVMEI
jgi:ribosome recycling factor